MSNFTKRHKRRQWPKALLGVPRLIDLNTLVGTYASTAALLTVFDMQLDAGETHLLPLLE
jgi:hypothetical protein